MTFVCHEWKIACHKQAIERYRRLLSTELSDLERDYIHRRIAENREALERLSAQTTSIAA